jgi:hypothetical protein
MTWTTASFVNLECIIVVSQSSVGSFILWIQTEQIMKDDDDDAQQSCTVQHPNHCCQSSKMPMI